MRTIGITGREHVKEKFLMTTDVKRWLLLFPHSRRGQVVENRLDQSCLLMIAGKR